MTMQDNLLDQAMEIQEAEIAREVRKARRKARYAPKATGKCLFCDEPLKPNERFCDTECAEDAERFGVV